MNTRSVTALLTLSMSLSTTFLAAAVARGDPLDSLTPPTVVGSAQAMPSAATPPPPLPGSAILAKLPWGTGAGQVGYYNQSTPGFDEVAPLGPQGVALAADGRIALADTFNNRIVLMSAAGGSPTTVTASALKLPWVLAFTEHHELLVGMGNPIGVLLLGKGGRVLGHWGAGGGKGGEELFGQLAGVALDSRGRLVAADLGRNAIVVVDQAGTLVTKMPWLGSGMALEGDKVVDLDFSDTSGYSLRMRDLTGAVVSSVPLEGAGREGARLVGAMGQGQYAVRFAPLSTLGRMSVSIFDAGGHLVRKIGELPHFAAEQSLAAGPTGLVWLDDDAGGAPQGAVTLRSIR